MAQTDKKINLVVVGGGFAGLRLVRKLAGDNKFRIILISDSPEFRYSPALYRTATGHRKRESSLPIETILPRSPNIHFIVAKLKEIDRGGRLLTFSNGKTLRYDYCVLALGVVTSYFGIPGLEEYSYSVKSPAEVRKLKSHLHKQLIDNQDMDKNYVIVGGGATGVELAAGLGQYMKRIARKHNIRRNKVNIELVEAANRLLPAMRPRASRIAAKRLKKLKIKIMLNKHVEGETASGLKVSGKSLPTQTVIWTAGVTNNPFFTRNEDQFKLDSKKRVVVDKHLRVDDRLFVIGDNSNAKYAGLAISAVRNANYVSWFIKHSLRGHVTGPYLPFMPISVVPLGTKHAVFQWGRIVFDGRLGGLLRVLADLIGYGDIMGYRKAYSLWRKRDDYEESCAHCRAPLNGE